MCYLMNPEDTLPLSSFGASYSVGFCALQNRIVLADDTGLTIIESDGTHWYSEDIALDGLKDLEIKNDIVSGNAYCYTGDWRRFSYDINRKSLKW